jgi:16S rRNA (uracil1498-N3)-methyltransferase
MLGEHQPRELELAGEICLYQGLPSGDKMDWVVEKSVELGVNRLIPITAQRSILQLSGPRLTKRLEHWQRIAQAAAEQCGRNRLMQIEAPCSLAQALSAAHAQPSEPSLRAITRLFCDPQASEDLRFALSQIEATLDSQHRVELLVGPEGGWSEAEHRLALKSGAKAISFGQRVLRTETAGLALVSATTALLGW